MPNDNNTKIFIPSAEAASRMITDAFLQNDYAKITSIQRLLQSTSVMSSISGSGDEFHNAAVNLTRVGMFGFAYDLIRVGINRNPRNTDLLGDALQYGMRCGTPQQELQSYYEQMQNINKRFWTWRAYHFSFDYLMWLLPYQDSDTEIDRIEGEIRAIIQAFKDHFNFLADQSDCEKAYMMEFEYYISRGETQNAYQALETGTRELPHKCAQCALKYADHLFESGDYRNTIEYAKIAVNIKEDQPSISLGYTYYILAMSQEWAMREDHAMAQEEKIKEVYNSYYSAYLNMEDGRDHLAKAIKNQVKTLEFETGKPSRIPFEELDEGRASIGMSSLLKALQSQSEK